MLKSLKILMLGMILLAPMAYGQLGRLADFDGVLQAKFALKISEADEDGWAEENLTLTSSSVIREYALPNSARAYWVFDFADPRVQGGLVLADRKTGEIYAVIAEAKQLAPEEVADGDEEVAGFGDIGIGAFLTARFELRFDIDGLEVSARPLIEFQFIEGGNVSFLRMNSLGALVGEGTFHDGTPLMVTDGLISASGTIANFN